MLRRYVYRLRGRMSCLRRRSRARQRAAAGSTPRSTAASRWPTRTPGSPTSSSALRRGPGVQPGPRQRRRSRTARRQAEEHVVALFVLPGVSKATVSGVSRAVASAGGEIVISGHLTRPWSTRPRRRTSTALPPTPCAASRTSRPAPLCRRTDGSGCCSRGPTRAASSSLGVDDESTRIDAQLQGAKLVSLHDPLQRRANAVVVLASGTHGGGRRGLRRTSDRVAGRRRAGDRLRRAAPAAPRPRPASRAG